MGGKSLLNMNQTETVFTKAQAFLENTPLAGEQSLVVAAVAAILVYLKEEGIG